MKLIQKFRSNTKVTDCESALAEYDRAHREVKEQMQWRRFENIAPKIIDRQYPNNFHYIENLF